jgi:hypothetical protein
VKQFIVTTTIHAPTKALLRFAAMKEWTLIVVGDKKTPHAAYESLGCVYLHPDVQAERYPALSEAIGWNTIQRRNIGFVEAYRRGADVVATVDDDNVPYGDWGTQLLIGREVDLEMYEPELDVFDPLAATDQRQLWHRGYPIEHVPQRHRCTHVGRARRKVLVQADLWDGDPDIDAIARLSMMPSVTFGPVQPYGSSRVGPFNSQNTFLAREVVPFYAVLPFVGRMDDIWGSYVLQARFPGSVAYCRASVCQERNPQDLVTNLQNELLGYRHTLAFVRGGADLSLPFVPAATRAFYELYRAQF